MPKLKCIGNENDYIDINTLSLQFCKNSNLYAIEEQKIDKIFGNCILKHSNFCIKFQEMNLLVFESVFFFKF